MTLDQLLEASHQGVAEAQFAVGILYMNGLGVAEDRVAAEDWFVRAAQSGFAGAQYELSLLLQAKGESHLVEAVDWLRRSVLNGFPPAQHLYSLYCEGGIGMNSDPTESFQVCLLAANQNYGPAVRRVAAMYEQGIGTVVDVRQAFNWYLRAAEAGDADSAASVGRMYAAGTGVERNEEKALQWLQEGERRGSPWGLLALSSVYRFGELGQSIDSCKADELARQAQVLIEHRASRGGAKDRVGP
jgi:uncharacterized protein